jgi:hypothetical protein
MRRRCDFSSCIAIIINGFPAENKWGRNFWREEKEQYSNKA